MRKERFKRLMAGAMLALIVATPTLAFAETEPPAQETQPAVPAVVPQNSDSADIKDLIDKLPISGDALIADRLRDIITSRKFGRASEREAIETFYTARSYAPLWIGDGGLNARAKSAIARLKNAAADGLDPADYPVPEFGAAIGPDILASNEIKLTTTLLAFARHLAAGRIAPTRVAMEVDYGNHAPEAADILRKIADANDVNAALDSFNPPHDGFRALKQKLAELRAGGKVLAASNDPKQGQPIERVLANMERWRWLPRDLGRTYVMVNVPDYTLRVIRDNAVVWRTKIIAGKPQTPTPLASASMDSVIVNPSWHVPQSIIQNELLPLSKKDPNIFSRMGLEVKRRPDGNINVVQPPGAANALGRIKFNFPNKFQVYLHDTPQKKLFASDKRAFSHGCMRVEDPTKFGEVMLRLAMNGQTPSSQQIASLFGHAEHSFKLVDRPMVHLTYQTVFVDDAGKLVLRDDIYGLDARIHAIMHSDERRFADVAPPQDPKRDAASAKANQEILSRVERREAQNPLAFFERVFR